jgi:ATP-dependent Clp protease ATP-binding subunit ClpA
MLLGLIKLGQGTAVNVLAKLGMDLETLRASVERHLPKGPDRKDTEDPCYTAQAQEVLLLANSECHQLARIFHSEIEQRSGESVRRLDITQPNENATHRFLYDRL